MMKDDIVTVYHGTAGILLFRIAASEELKPKSGNRYVYVTTDKERAMNYSRAWTAWALRHADEIEASFGVRPEPTGLIVSTQIRREFLEDDPYNPKGEPDQYRVKGFISLDDADFDEVIFEEFRDNAALMRWYAYWIGIARATDDI